VILNGDARRLPLVDGSCYTCVTSPPYWGLRRYEGVEPSVWGGDPDCEHVWEAETLPPKHSDDGISGSGLDGGKATQAQAQRSPVEYAYCQRCGAWRGCLGLEPCIEDYVAHLVEVFREVKRVLRDDGTCWVNLGDSYASRLGGDGWAGYDWKTGGPVAPKKGSVSGVKRSREDVGLKPKDQCLIPHRVALALQADGWYLRSTIVWAKGLSFCDSYSGSVMPESVTDRPTSAHEYVFLLAKSPRYYYDQDAEREAAKYGRRDWQANQYGRTRQADPRDRRDAYVSGAAGSAADNPSAGRNLRTVWTVNTASYRGAHFATFPPALVRPMVNLGCPAQCCPVCGKGWERVTEKERSWESGSGRAGNLPNGKNGAGMQGGGATLDVRRGPSVAVVTLGFRPACDCLAINGDTPHVPGLVLDPFAGSGTVGLVCDELGRRFVGVDASAPYCAMARRRIAAARRGVKTAPEEQAVETLPLFEEKL